MSRRRPDPYSMSNPGASGKTPLVPSWVAEHEEHIQPVLYIRCSGHRNVPQLNHNEHSGGECGACVRERGLALAQELVGSFYETRNGYPLIPVASWEVLKRKARRVIETEGRKP